MDNASDPLDPTNVCDRTTFLAFVRALATDCRKCAPFGPMAGISSESPFSGLWITFDLCEFLDNGVDWVEHLGSNDTDFPGVPDDFSSKPEWTAFARFLFMAKTYYIGRDRHK
jgi:hypothetical protein